MEDRAYGILIEGFNYLALRVDALWHAESAVTRDIGIREVVGEVVPVQLPTLLQYEDVGEAFGGQKCRLGHIPRHDRVRSAGRAVDEQVRIGQDF